MRKRGTAAATGRTKRLRVPYARGGEQQFVEVEVPDTGEPEPQQMEEAAHFLKMLQENHQLAEGPGPLPSSATHRIETLPDGTKRLVRARFSFA